jgi:hypothetical protein
MEISTGSDMFITDFPAMMLDVICFMMVFSMPFWLLRMASSQKMYSSFVIFHCPPCSRKSLSAFKLYLLAW